MACENNSILIPVAEQNALIEDITLQMEELEAREAPSTVWGD